MVCRPCRFRAEHAVTHVRTGRHAATGIHDEVRHLDWCGVVDRFIIDDDANAEQAPAATGRFVPQVRRDAAQCGRAEVSDVR